VLRPPGYLHAAQCHQALPNKYLRQSASLCWEYSLRRGISEASCAHESSFLIPESPPEPIATDATVWLILKPAGRGKGSSPLAVPRRRGSQYWYSEPVTEPALLPSWSGGPRTGCS
jgi:hypothetical protein